VIAIIIIGDFYMRFEWDENKNILNKRTHGVSFEEAREVFTDPLHLSILDYRFNYYEERWITIGKTIKGNLLVVANIYFDENYEEVIKIISARNATLKERIQYEDTKK